MDGGAGFFFRPGLRGSGNFGIRRKMTMKSWRWFYHGKDIRGWAANSALTLVLLLAPAALLVDFGQLLLMRWQVQQAADAGATAGARALAYGTSLNFSLAVSRATATVRECWVGGELLRDFNADGSLKKVQAGYWDLRWTKDTAPANLNGYTAPASYIPSAHEVPAVKVNLIGTSSGLRPLLSAYLASFMGFGHMDVATFAVALRPGGGGHVYGAYVNETKLVN